MEITRVELYSKAAQEAKALLLGQENIPSPERRKLLFSFLDKLWEEETSVEKMNGLHEDARKLLLSDPLSDQQAGALARWLLERRRSMYLKHTGALQMSPQQELEELIELRVGDWNTVNQMCTSNAFDRQLWESIISELSENSEPVRVYRGMKLDKENLELTKRFGFIPHGLYKASQDNTFNGWSSLAKNYTYRRSRFDKDKTDSFLGQLWATPICKGNLFTAHWGRLGGEADDSGYTSESLAISTAPSTTQAWNHKYLFELSIPRKRLVRRYAELGIVDDSVLFYIDPDSIVRVHDRDSVSWKIRQISKQ